MLSQNLTATLLFFTTFLFVSRSISAVHSPPVLNATTNDLNFIRTSCNATLHPDLCFRSLAGYASSVQSRPARLTKIAVGVTISKAKSTVVFLSKLSPSSTEVQDCVSFVSDAIDEMRDSLQTLSNIRRGAVVAAAPSSAATPSAETFGSQMSDVMTSISAAMTYEETCTDEYEEMDEAGEIQKTVCDRVNKLKMFTSNALALANSYANNGSP